MELTTIALLVNTALWAYFTIFAIRDMRPSARRKRPGLLLFFSSLLALNIIALL